MQEGSNPVHGRTPRRRSTDRVPTLTRADFELECIREFSHSGCHLGADVSREERRERIRAAILRERKEHQPWRSTEFTYCRIYEHVYGKPLAEGRYEVDPAPTLLNFFESNDLNDGPLEEDLEGEFERP